MINADLKAVSKWFDTNKLTLNIEKTNYIHIPNSAHNTEKTNIILQRNKITETNHAKFLGIIVDNKLSWSEQIKCVNSKIASTRYMIGSLRNILKTEHLKLLYSTLMEPHLLYGITLWGGATKSKLKKTTVLQKKAIRSINKSPFNCHTEPIFKRLCLLKLSDIYVHETCKLMYKLMNKSLPVPLQKYFNTVDSVHSRNLRENRNLRKPNFKINSSTQSVLWRGPELWNSLPDKIKAIDKGKAFSKHLKNHLLDIYVNH